MTNLTKPYEATLGAQLLVPGTDYYVGLAYGASNLENGDATDEVTEAGYARQAVQFEQDPGNPSRRRTTSLVEIVTSETNLQPFTHWFIAESATEGANDLIVYGALSEARTYNSNGGTTRWAAGLLGVSLS